MSLNNFMKTAQSSDLFKLTIYILTGIINICSKFYI